MVKLPDLCPAARTASLIELWDDEQGLIVSRVYCDDADHFRLSFADGISFDVSSSAHLISDSSTASLPSNTARHLLYDQVMPRVIAQTGSLVLHAAAICYRNRAMLVMGESGRGKSTIAASFDQSGDRLMGDDAAVITWLENQACAASVYPSLRLLRDSIEALLPGDVSTQAIAHYSPKQRIDVTRVTDDVSPAIPIVAVFEIAPPSKSDLVSISRMTVADACMSFIENSFALNPSDTFRARERMEQASALARQVPAFEISYPRDYSRLAEVRQAMLDQVAALEPA